MLIKAIKNDLHGAATIFGLLKNNDLPVPPAPEIFDTVTELWGANNGKFPIFVALNPKENCFDVFTKDRQVVQVKISSVDKEQPMDEEKIVLHDVEGIARKSGTDQNGLEWVQFEVDYFAEQEPGTCSICGEEITEGWLCMDDSTEICDDHVHILSWEE